MDWGVIFDWDGVVIDSSSAHKLSWEALARQTGKAIPADHMERGFGKKNTLIIPDILGWSDDPETVKELSDRKEALYRELLAAGHGRVMPGARELLLSLRAAGVPCAVGSSTDRANIEQAIQQFGLDGFFKGIAAAEDVHHGKPAPDVFLAAARRIGLPPGRCLVIEDAPYGVEAAHRAGMQAVAVLTSHSAATMAAADLIAADMTQLDLAGLARLVHP